MTTLRDEILTGPLAAELAPFVAAGDDGGVAAILNRKDISTYGEVTRQRFAIWAASTGMRAAIQDIAATSGHALRSSALALLDVLGGASGGIDFSVAENVVMLSAWVALGALTQANHDSLLAASVKLISRAEQVGLVADIPSVAVALRG